MTTLCITTTTPHKILLDLIKNIDLLNTNISYIGDEAWKIKIEDRCTISRIVLHFTTNGICIRKTNTDNKLITEYYMIVLALLIIACDDTSTVYEKQEFKFPTDLEQNLFYIFGKLNDEPNATIEKFNSCLNSLGYQQEIQIFDASMKMHSMYDTKPFHHRKSIRM